MKRSQLKNKILNRLMLLVLTVVATTGCERDDICAEATPTTPHLIIRFYNINDAEELKMVRKLSVRGFDANGEEIDEEIFAMADTDSIVLPLHIAGEMPTTSTFILEKDRDFVLDEDPDTESNIDIIAVTYTPEFIYVSRACGYKSIFSDTSFAIEPDAQNWVLAGTIVNTTIDHETRAHINLRH